MKHLNNYIYEMSNKHYNADEYKKDTRHNDLKDIAQAYIDAIGGKDALFKCVDNAIKKTNKILQLLYDNGISEFVNGQMLGRIIERKLAQSMDLDGITYEQGKEASNDKDIECTSVSDNIKDKVKKLANNKLKVNLDEPHAYGIELKCSQGSGITGNKSYAIDIDDGKGTKSSKDAFYILINYKGPIEIADTVDDQSSEDVKDNLHKKFIITIYSVHFGFIEQNDWVYGEKGNAASLKMGILKEKRLIKIK